MRTAVVPLVPTEEMRQAGIDAPRMAEGCCSAVSPCSHQRRDPYSICEICRKAGALTDRIQAAVPSQEP